MKILTPLALALAVLCVSSDPVVAKTAEVANNFGGPRSLVPVTGVARSKTAEVAINFSGPRSLVPVTGVARSKTSEAANNLSGPRSLVPVAGYTDKLSYDDMSGEWFSGPADRGKTDDYVGDQDPGAGMWIDCPPYEPCDDPALHDDGAFLPWHRGSIYQ